GRGPGTPRARPRPRPARAAPPRARRPDPGRGERSHLAAEARRGSLRRRAHRALLRPAAPDGPMRIVYVASDQRVPGRTGGSVHVLEVARGLAGRGHQVHAVVHREPGVPDHDERDGVCWHRVAWRPRHRRFRFRARGAVEELLAEVRPQAVMERYYNFGGEGILAAKQAGIPSLLEVNSPAVDHPGSVKALLDAAVLVRPLRRRRERLCASATVLVSPLLEIVPEFARPKTVKMSWGANVDAFHPSRRRAELRAALGVPEKALAAIFIGSFRPWHGVHVLEAAARRLAH